MPEEQRHDLLERLSARRERHARRSKAYRAGFAAVGFLVLALGIVLIPLPGPGVLVAAVGLAMLALEFAWAERLLERAVRQLELARRTATEASLLQRVLGLFVVFVAAAAGLAAVIVWDIPFLPV